MEGLTRPLHTSILIVEGRAKGQPTDQKEPPMSLRITEKAVEVYDTNGELVVWELHHTNSRRSAAFFLGTVCEVYGICDKNLNAQILEMVKGK